MTAIPFLESNPEQRVAMVMTGAAFNAAERSHVDGISADLAAMADIARIVLVWSPHVR
jgi:hypothetical protein